MNKKNINTENTVFLVDGSSFLYRAYYSLKPLYTIDGTAIQAVYGFCRMIKKMIDTFNPHYFAIVWDSKGKTTRHEMYPAYKATRQEPPSDLFQQKELILEFCDLIGLKTVSQSGIEADDLMYSIAQDLSKKGTSTLMITSDKDMSQSLSTQIHVFDPFKDAFFDEQSFAEKMGFPVQKLSFYFSLLGDSTDNIPGVRGIGKKGATDLVQQFESLDDLYANLESVQKERTRQALIEQKNNAYLSHTLFLLQYHTLNLTKDDFFFNASDWHKARSFFEKLNFKSLLRDFSSEKTSSLLPTLSQIKKYKFETITTEKGLSDLVSQITEKQLFAIDTELDGLNPLFNKVIGLSISIEKGHSYYIPWGHKADEPQLTKEVIFALLKPAFQNPSIKKIFHYAKFDVLALYHSGVIVQGVSFDTLLAAHLITEDWQRIGLKYLSEYYLQERMLHFNDVMKIGNYKNFSEVPLALATEYAAADSHQTLQLAPFLEKQIEEQKLHDLYYNIELPLSHVLFEMETRGIWCDKQVLETLNKSVTQELNNLKEKIITLIGPQHRTINLNSPKQLAHLLFNELKLSPVKKTTGKTNYSTDQAVLEELSKFHPVPGLIVRYRELFKLKSTYLEALPKEINPETGRIHTTFSQTAVATGRLSSFNPNLQNIPVDSTHYKNIHIRSAFKPSAGRIFLSADYSQIELRVLAFLSQDAALVDAFLKGHDIHQETTAKLFDVALEDVTSEQRQIGKRINFSILYGLTPYGLSKDLKIPFGQAKEYIEKYFEQYPGVSAWMDKVIEKTKETGYVTTYWARRRYLPGIYEQNKTLYDMARRAAINTVAQGTAAELMKKGMISLDHALKEKNIDAYMLLQIHDELLLSVCLEQKEVAQKVTQDILESVVQWNVPLVVTTRFGNNWQEVTK